MEDTKEIESFRYNRTDAHVNSAASKGSMTQMTEPKRSLIQTVKSKGPTVSFIKPSIATGLLTSRKSLKRLTETSKRSLTME